MKKSDLIQDFTKSLSLVPQTSRNRILLFTLIQCLLSVLDLLALVVVAAIGAIAIRGFSSQDIGEKITVLLDLFHLETIDYEKQVAILILIAVLFLIFKTIFSMIASKKILRELSQVSTVLSVDILHSRISSSYKLKNKIDLDKVHYAVTQGINAIVFGVVGSSLLIAADLFLLVLLCGGFFVIDIAMALSTLVLFGVVGVLISRRNRGKAKNIGKSLANFHGDSYDLVAGVWGNLTEIHLRSSSDAFLNKFRSIRLNHEDDLVNQSYLPNVGKYYGEMAVILGSVFIGFSQFMIKDLAHAIASLGVFMAGASRIAPAILRIHQNSVQIQMSLGSAKESLIEFDPSSELKIEHPVEVKSQSTFPPAIDLININFAYPGQKATIQKVDLHVNAGEFIAIVGPSGSGKSTLLNLIMGTLEPDLGKVEIGGKDPITFHMEQPGAFGFVPQNVSLLNGSIEENLLLGLLPGPYIEWIKELLEISSLQSVSDLALPMKTLSGGERQRIGLARALVTKPRLLLLDEPTSALDAQTEEMISKQLLKLKGQTTLVLIAHRLSTVQQADRIFYMNQGSIVANGSFDELRRQVPDFDLQAKLMGL